MSLLDTSTEFVLTNTTTRPGAIRLPSTFQAEGRILTIKDATGAWGRSTLTLAVNNANQTFEDGSLSTLFTTAGGWTTLISGTNNKWYTIGGTQLNSVQTSTIQSSEVSAVNISTGLITMSTLILRDQRSVSTQSLFTASTFLYYNISNQQSSIVAGTRQATGFTLLRMRGLFQPRQIATLSYWIDALDASTVINPANITGLRDKSGFGYTLSNGQGFVLRSNFNGGYPVFDSPVPTDGFLLGSNASFTLTGPFTCFAVGLQARASFLGYIFDGANGTNRVAILDGGTMYTNTGGYYSGAVNRALFQSNFVGTWSMNGASSYINTNGTLNSSGNLTNGTFGGIIVGNRFTNNSTNQWCSSLCELLIYNSALTAAQVQVVEGYLAWKWGLVANLPANHAYKNVPP